MNQNRVNFRIASHSASSRFCDSFYYSTVIQRTQNGVKGTKDLQLFLALKSREKAKLGKLSCC